MCVSDFGPLPCSIITTTRKFFTVLFSVIIFGTILAGHQWIGVVLVFSGTISKHEHSQKRGKRESLTDLHNS